MRFMILRIFVAAISLALAPVGAGAQWTMPGSRPRTDAFRSTKYLTNPLAADVLLTNDTLYFDGPSVAQGPNGTWFASATVSLVDTGFVATFFCKLTDGTTIVSSALGSVAAGYYLVMSLSGVITSPAGNIRISCKDNSSGDGVMRYNISGLGKDSTITVRRMQ
jgi:hypothetical protein